MKATFSPFRVNNEKVLRNTNLKKIVDRKEHTDGC